ncbi:MAG: RagB/SusD family nutrient uptake outer membrane protein [Mariniphaga sp.]
MNKNVLYLVALTFLIVSCSDDYLETNPTNQVSDQVVFNTVDGAQTVLDGVLRDMRFQHSGMHDQFGVKSVDLASDLMGEDMVVEKFHWFGADYRFENHGAKGFRSVYTWTLFYRMIYNLNEIINQVDDAKAGNEAQKKQLKAQALSLRAWSYFQLIQLYQHTYAGHEDAPGVPVYVEADKTGNSRSTVAEVYEQVTADLDEAMQLFGESNQARRHISNLDLNVAKGLRARVALVMRDWDVAAEMASGAREGYTIMTVDEYSSGFDDYTQQNWIWGLEVNAEQSTTYASWVSHVDWSVGGYAGYGFSRKSVSSKLYDLMADGDVRKQLVDTTFMPGTFRPNKFSAGDDKGFAADLVLMRPEEMLLIEAEAKARMGQEDEARNLLRELRNKRMTETGSVDASGEQLIEEILLERRIELWGEGFGLLDIKRLKKGIDRTNSNHKPAVAKTMTLEAESPKFNFQIPQQEIDSNPNISEADQNP